MPIRIPARSATRTPPISSHLFCKQTALLPARKPMTAQTIVPIGAVATRRRAAARHRKAVKKMPRRALPLRREPSLSESSSPGEVKNYVPVTDEMLLKPDPADWLIVRGKLPGLESQRAHANHPRQREGPAAGVVVEHERQRGGQRAHAARPQRHHLPDQHRQHHAGARRADGRPHLGKPHAAAEEPGRRNGRDAQHRDLPGQNFRGDDGRAPVRARRAHRQNRVGRHGRRQRQGLRQFERADRHSRQGDSRRERMRPLQGAGQGSRLLHQRVRSRDRKTAVALQHHRARGRTRRRHLGRSAEHAARRRGNLDHRQLRSRAEPDVLGRGAGQAVDAGEPRHEGLGAVFQLDARPEARRWKTRLVFPARAGRNARHGRSVRARARRYRRPQNALHHRQGRHSLEARSQDRRISRRQGNYFSEYLQRG